MNPDQPGIAGVPAHPCVPAAAAEKAAPEHLAWLAQGVRQHILLRVLPVQRHDALGPLSVARMALALVQRRLANPEPALQALADKVAEVDTQVVDAVKALACLRWWDSAHQPPRPWAEVVHDAAHLLQLAMSLRGHSLATGALWPEAAPGTAAHPLVATPAGHLAVLGLLIHALDQHADQPQAFSLASLADATGPQGRAPRLRLQRQAVEPDRQALAAAALLPMATRSAPGLDWTAYQWLMADTGWHAEVDPQGWTLTAPPRPT